MPSTPGTARSGLLLVAALVCAQVGCLSSEVIVCPDTGLVCPAGTACSPDGRRCLGLEQPSCGDGVLVPLGANGVPDDPNGPPEEQDDEVCDDGNRLGGDGCSANCKSIEVCGNGVRDVFEFGGELVPVEECDDGNALGLDGCSSRCETVHAMWQATAVFPADRDFHAMAYDAARGRVVLFGGFDGTNRNDTWEWDGRAWTDVTPEGAVPSPSARRAHAMAYDAARGRVVLFGGYDGTNRNDTWEWDGGVWTNVTPGSGDESPPPRTLHSMSYDAGRKRVVLFGGYDASRMGDTWEWDGHAWTNVAPSTESPSARYSHATAYDASRGVVVLFGGIDSNERNDTWEWDGSAWTNVTPGPPEDPPDPRRRHAMAYDAARGRVVLFGGYRGSTMGDTWEWDGTSWNPGVSVDAPPKRNSHAMAYDAARGRVVLFGGSDSSRMGDTWEWGSAGWQEVTLASESDSATPRFNHAMAYDSARGRVVLFGGYDGSAGPRDTWEWNGDVWTDVSPAGDSPPALNRAAMSYDAARGRVLLFGGATPGSNVDLHSDSWLWDGSVWTNATPSGVSPLARLGHAMTYDGARERVVLFGGSSDIDRFADTWEWDGSAWSDVTPVGGSPSARSGHAMAFDAARGRVVLFGGSDASKALNDIWEWDGESWIDVTPALAADSPSARDHHALVYDAALGRVVLFGGASSSKQNDTWEWNGDAWTNVTPPGEGPPPRASHALAYDARSGRTVLFGGFDSEYLQDTWMFSHRAVGPTQCHSGFDGDDDGLIGCDDPDCWGLCTPLCPPGSTPMWPTDCEASKPHCGDGACNEDLESARLCPSDCGAPLAICGDFHCDPPETASSCPGDCDG